jgi:L-ascorbate metabolism protein UlaG (beta-lactamase superfamily)
MKVTMIGHSTVLIEGAGKRILTDPFFSTRGNPAYKRIAPPARTREELTAVDVVLVSHNHWDHTDRAFFRALPASVPVVTGKAWTVKMKGARNVVPLDDWEAQEVAGIRVSAVPASHLAVSPRGFVIEADGRTVYFAGDTYYRPFLEEVARRFRLDLALLPVATFRTPTTMGEKKAVRAAQTLAPRTIIPIHLGLTPRSPLLRSKESADGFARRCREAGVAADIAILRDGQSCEL